jgi:cell division protein FtsL
MVIVAVVLAAWWVYPTFRLQYENQHEVQTLESELGDLKSRNEELRQEIDGLKTPEGVEQLARESLGMVKPGEHAYVVTGSAVAETTATVDATATGADSFWQRTLDTLFGLD